MIWVGELVESSTLTVTLIALGIGSTAWTDHSKRVPQNYMRLVIGTSVAAFVSWIALGWTLAFSS